MMSKRPVVALLSFALIFCELAWGEPRSEEVGIFKIVKGQVREPDPAYVGFGVSFCVKEGLSDRPKVGRISNLAAARTFRVRQTEPNCFSVGDNEVREGKWHALCYRVTMGPVEKVVKVYVNTEDPSVSVDSRTLNSNHEAEIQQGIDTPTSEDAYCKIPLS